MKRIVARPGPRGYSASAILPVAFAPIRKVSAEVSAEQKISDALDVLKHEYHNEVRALADEARKMTGAGELKDAEAVSTWLDETVDGHAWVIYTFKAQMVCLCSDNDGAIEEMGMDGAWTLLAYCALRHDVMEALGDLEELFSEE